MAASQRTTPTPAATWARLLLVGLIAGASGCSGEPGNIAVSGRVTYKGQPIEHGSITLTSETGRYGASSEISAGRFETTADQSLQPGNYRVEIYATEETGRMITDSDEPDLMMAETRNIVPPKYNIDSQLTQQLDFSTTELNFDLE